MPKNRVAPGRGRRHGLCGHFDSTSISAVTTGNELSGAATQAQYDGLGLAHQYEYCFAAGTPVLLADGTTRPIEQIIPGDIVLAVSDSNPLTVL